MAFIRGTTADDLIFGTQDRSDEIYGDKGDDIIVGTGAGSALFGEVGDDTIILTNPGSADGGEGIDNLRFDYRSANDRIHLDLLAVSQGQTVIVADGTLSGFERSVSHPYGSISYLTGFDDILWLAHLGNDSIDGANGNDIIYGGDGNDTAIHGGNDDDSLYGQGGDDSLYGDQGADALYGGAGDDIFQSDDGDLLVGGDGNDSYHVQQVAAVIMEEKGEGTDTVSTDLGSFTLSKNVENLQVSSAYQPAIQRYFTGNAINNQITGGDRYDTLTGLGGDDVLIGGPGSHWNGVAFTASPNMLVGGTGDDSYFISTGYDIVVELAGEGEDTVFAGTQPVQNINLVTQFTLPSNVENLTDMALVTFTGTGNALNNRLTGGHGVEYFFGLDGDDIIIGGNGSDTLLGGIGADQFRYLGGETGLDRIYDFESDADKIMLADTGFVHTASIDVVQGSAPVAESENSTFLYDPTTGLLSYDADGKDVGAAVVLAQLNMALTLDVADFGFF